MIFFANRANLDRRRLLTRIYNQLQTQVTDETAPVEQVRYHTSRGNKLGVRATIAPELFLDRSYPTRSAELHVSFDFPGSYSYDFYRIHWVESARELMLGWHQDETHNDLGNCHFQVDHEGETVQRTEAASLDSHPLNVFDQRTDDLVDVLEALAWEDGVPAVPAAAVH